MANAGIIQKAAAQKTEVTTAKAPKTMRDYVKSMEGEIAKALPSVITPERFTRMVFTALSSTPKLQECTPQSFLGAMMTAAQLGVEPNTALGQAYILPYRNKGRMEASFQLGYKGLIDLAYRSGQVKSIQAHVVYENDDFEYEFGLDPKLKHVPATTNRGAPIAYYAVYNTKDGGFGFEVMSIEDVRAFARKYSKSFGSDSSPWTTNFDSMAKKTVLKQVLKYAPLKTDFVRGIAQDETVHHTIGSDMTMEESMQIESEGSVSDTYEYVDDETGEVTQPDQAPAEAK